MPTVPIDQTCPGVTESGDFLVFRVASQRPGHAAHRVDLQKFCANGHCTCEDFTIAKRTEFRGKLMTKHQALLAGAIPSPALECKHIQRAKRFVTFCLLNRMIEDRERKTRENKATAQARPVGQRIPQTTRPANPAGQRPQSRSFRVGERTPFARQGGPQNPPANDR